MDLRRFAVRPRRLGTPAVLGVAVATFTALAVNSQGFPVQHVSLNDGGIWVTNNAAGAIGRFNKPIAQLDGQVNATSAVPNLDVWQNGDLVAAYDKSSGRLYSVNVSRPAFTDGGTAASAAQIALGGDTLAVLGTDHDLRVATMDQPGASVASAGSAAAPVAKRLPSGTAITVDAAGDVYAAGGGQLRVFGASGPAGAVRPVTSSVPLPSADALEVTAVGNVPVIADATTRTLYLPAAGKTVTLPAADTSGDLTLQQSSPAGPLVAAATSRALYSVNLSTGVLTTLSGGHTGNVAAPVQVAGCVHAAWNDGGAGTYVRSCGGQPASAGSQQAFQLGDPDPTLVFRVNRGEVVLNDTADGGVFLVDSTVVNARPQWQQVTQPNKSNNASQSVLANQNAPLIARPYTQGVRPGRTTLVHVLDNDSGPGGAVLAVTAVGKPDQPQVSVAIAPNGQGVLATVASGLAGNAHFEYTIDDGRGHTAQAEVTLVPRAPGQNAAPAPRPDYHQPGLTVASSGSLDIPVTGDWRDYDGDPLYVDSASVHATAGTVGVTSGGAISFTAPQATSAATVTIRYGVSDGIVARPTMASLTVSVLAASSTQPVPPVAEPDVAQAIVGMPVTIRPLANDIPGADPTNPRARLAVGAPVTSVAGASVSTDLQTGTVTFTAQRPGPFFLSYQAIYGAAQPSWGTIRVQVAPATGQPKPPVTVPAVAVLHGQQPALVDVLAGDFDPQGWILGVLSVTSAKPGITASVVDQQWIRVSSDNPQSGSTSTVTYTVSDGARSATGTVSVTAQPQDTGADQITTQDDSVVIRAGDSAAVPVLANDSSSDGLPLELAQTEPVAAPAIPGLYASVQGQDVRVTVPASVSSGQETTVSYVATDASGATATGQVDVTIEPPPSKAHPNQAPSPADVTTRETAGDVAVIQIPADGIDPDGDSTTVTAVTAPPALGRIVAVGADTITYQSYPDSTGTDTFTYQVTDPYGATGTAQVHIGIMPPGPPQPPVAVDNILNAPPGATVHVDVLANAIVAPGDPAAVVPLGQTDKNPPPGAKLEGGYAYLTAPASPADAPAEVTYGITDGSAAPSLAQFVVRAVAGARVPPIAGDVTARPPAPGAASVTVNVLSHDDDPVGSVGDLKITGVAAGVRVRGPDLVIPVKPLPRAVPYEVTAPDGLAATAVVFVPGTATSAIRLKPGARITLKPRGSVTVPLSQVLTDSFGRALRLTTLSQLSASPAGDVAVTASQATAFNVTAPGGYNGPGAVTVQVYDGSTIQDPRGHVATVTVPVQVGPDVPILRCPQAPIDVVEGGAPVTYDIGLLCHAWIDTTISAPAPHYTVAWGTRPGGVSATATNGGASVALDAGSGARPGATGTVRITPGGGSAAGTIAVAVVAAPPPTGQAVTVSTLAGHSVTVDLRQYVTSPLAQPDIQVTGTTRPAGAAVSSGGSQVTITPGAGTHGTLTVVADVTDVPGRADRQIGVSITVTVIGHPGRPGTPSVKTSSQTMVVSFAQAAANGAPVQYYTVYTSGAAHQCPASPCTITGLANGTTYNVNVTATNSDGAGPASATVTAQPNAVPGQVTGLTATPKNAEAALGWQPARVNGTPVTKYVAVINPAPAGGAATQTLGASATSTTFTGLSNGTTYTFYVTAVNILGAGPQSTPVTAVPFGKPLTVAAPTASGAILAGDASTAITVTWSAPGDNGSPITGYTVQEYDSSGSGGPWSADGSPATAGPGATSYTFSNLSNDGTWYAYTVTAANAAGSTTSAQSSGVQAAAPPATPAAPSASASPTGSPPSYGAGVIHVTLTVPQPHAAHLTSINYGLNAQSVSGTWTGPFTPGATVTETITGLTDGASYTVSIQGCNDAASSSDNCGGWSGASNGVMPYGLPNPPASAGAAANGQSITFSWSGGSANGYPIASYDVCIDNSNCGTQPYNGGNGGSETVNYGYSQTHSVTVYTVDTQGQRSSAVTSPSATTVPPPPPTVSVTRGAAASSSVGNCTNASICAWVDVTVANFTPGATLRYACYDNGSLYWPTSGTITEGNADGSGSASFQTQCIWGYWSNHVTLSVTVTDSSGKSATGSYTG